MRRGLRTVLPATLAAAALAAAGSVANGATAASGDPLGCSTATAAGPTLVAANPTFTRVGASPFGVATTPGYAFVGNVGALDVLADRAGSPRLIHKVALSGGGLGLAAMEGLGLATADDGRYLLIADSADGAIVVDTARAEAGASDAVLGILRKPAPAGNGGGAIEVAASRDGRYAFVSLEGSGQIAVYDLAAAIKDHFSHTAYVGAIPTGVAPVGLAVSPNGRWLYSTSEEGAPPGAGLGGSSGSLSVIDIATAETHPGRSLLATVSAGCQPVRVAVSPDGNVVWVTVRGSDELVAFSAEGLRAHRTDPELARVRVGEAPVGVAVSDGGGRVIVADSDRFDTSGATAALTLVSSAAALGHREAILGIVRAEQFPRDMALEPAGTVVLVSNFGSGTLEAVHIGDHAQESSG